MKAIALSAPSSRKQISILPKLRAELDTAINRLPKIEGAGGEVHVSNELNRILNLMDKLAQKRKDQYISSELFLLAAVEDNGTLGDLLRHCGGNKAAMEKAVDEERGGEKVDDPNAEEQRNALTKYTIDLTEQASKGKLDPVIGRDQETSSHPFKCYSARTKNNPVLIGVNQA